jgi:hypothetical protein
MLLEGRRGGLRDGAWREALEAGRQRRRWLSIQHPHPGLPALVVHGSSLRGKRVWAEQP